MLDHFEYGFRIFQASIAAACVDLRLRFDSCGRFARVSLYKWKVVSLKRKFTKKAQAYVHQKWCLTTREPAVAIGAEQGYRLPQNSLNNFQILQISSLPFT